MKPLTLSGNIVDFKVNKKYQDNDVFRVFDMQSKHGGNKNIYLITTEESENLWGDDENKVYLYIDGLYINKKNKNFIVLPKSFSYLSSGDAIAFNFSKKNLRVLFRENSRHNYFLVTENCNHYCLMCSQPPKNLDDSWVLNRLKKLIPLLPCKTDFIGFTGGEPFTNVDSFLEIISLCNAHVQANHIHVLSNGRYFKDRLIAEKLSKVANKNLTIGIPLYSSVDWIHDYVVQSKGALNETMMGILHLKEYGLNIEIRVVLNKITTERLEETALWISKNLPFVNHVALMGLENTGFALANDDVVWIDPVEYKKALSNSVNILQSVGLSVSIYNLPFCVLDQSVWNISRQSIADWKNAYLPQCETCQAKPYCAGFFSSGRPKLSSGITPVKDSKVLELLK
ncbi:His-Xaa-Ser system radical SAM maturase HxsC [Komagataeibacter xylinus]|uniref:His-Xaa-Ser system radical SAM maturase HxsC n=1 Tax=Komagataeibacter xylinus TaxID=28448 RepID=A0A318PHL6_KOMXY|nr:His-Xaa-Ser system radical SAM maturase HxsC [Komagataeibacter xylinus]PYD55615.1 His-Xaa-Ser system radical SAM maturase HxsC [Komagataeibacter xylinus]GBQ75111.1 radical SAM domain-containing protein [Komagataeibacter xylinus NBRC 15237]